MSQDLSSRTTTTGQDTAPWLILGAIVTGFVSFSAAWFGGTLGVLVAGAGWAPPPFGFKSMVTLVFRGGPGKLWPGHSTAAVAGICVLLAAVAVLAGLGVLGWRRVRSTRTGLATRRDLAPLAPRAALARARELRPSLAGLRQVRPEDTGIPLGVLRSPGGQLLRASHEDTLLAVMAPRSGKTTAMAVPAIIGAPGAVLATSNKPDLYTTTAQFQGARGQVWVLDPQHILHTRRELWWDMLATARTVEGATRLAGNFIAAGTDAQYRGDFWTLAGKNLLTALFHAAAVGRRSVADVMLWLATPTDRTPMTLLKDHDREAMSRQLASTVAGAPETRDGIYETARQSVSCLLDPQVLAWVTPDPRVRQFVPDDFVRTADSVYLLSKDGGGSAAGVIAAAADAVLRAAMDAAERAGGRLDPPMLAVLDEAANICRIEDLPDLYSHLGSRGVNPMTILQSYRQGVRVWGEPGMDALWSAATVKVIGAGMDDADFADKLSRLVGEHRIFELSVSHGTTGRNVSTQRQRERVLDAGEIRRLSKGSALLLATGMRIGLLRLLPWYTGPHAPALSAAAKAETAAIAGRAGSAGKAAP